MHDCLKSELLNSTQVAQTRPGAAVSPATAAQHAAQERRSEAGFYVCDIDAALLELGERGAGLALLVDGEGRATVCELDVPIDVSVADRDVDDVSGWASESGTYAVFP